MSKTKFVNLATSDVKTLNEQCEMCVIGAGAAGIYLANELGSHGVDVILIEAGNTTCSTTSEIGFEALFDADIYPGATEGRGFGLGGSTALWGGKLVPHTWHDLRETGEIFNIWNHILQTINDKTVPVLKKLGWRYGDDFFSFAENHLNNSYRTLRTTGIDVSAGLFLPFRKKNFVNLLKTNSANKYQLKVIYNAVVNNWQTKPNSLESQIQKIQAVSHNGNLLQLTARQFIIAAGTIESARILLELNQSSNQPLIPQTSAIGCYLSDHLSLPIANVDVNSISTATKLFAPCFSKGWMRGFRLLESKPPNDAPRAFTHFIFENNNPGFTLAKEALSALQGKRLPKISILDVVSGMDGLMRLAYYRYAHSTLYIPPNTNVHLQLDIEQIPDKNNSVKLSDELDQYGRRIAKIHWHISRQDIENIRLTAERFLGKWSQDNLLLPKLLPIDNDCDARRPYDTYHPVGTCRMGKDNEAVVDENLKVYGIENLWLVSTAVLPTAGTANPTFTMLCLADKLADQLTFDRYK